MDKAKAPRAKERFIDAEALREVLQPIYENLREKGVNDKDLPREEYVVARLLEFVDQTAINKWLDEYAKWINSRP